MKKVCKYTYHQAHPTGYMPGCISLGVDFLVLLDGNKPFCCYCGGKIKVVIKEPLLQADTFYGVVGLLIKEARNKKKCTQKQLADSIGLSRTSLSNIEAGRQRISLETFAAICVALDVDIAALFTRVIQEVKNE